MHRKTTILAVVSLCLCLQAAAQKLSASAQDRIVVEGQFAPQNYKKEVAGNGNVAPDSIEIKWTVYDYVTVVSAPYAPAPVGESSTVKEKMTGDRGRWIFHSKKPLILTSNFFDRLYVYVNPGDSIHISYEGDKPVFTGKGVDAFRLQYEIGQIKKQKKPGASAYSLQSVNDYFQWMKYYDNQLAQIIQLIEAYKNKIGPLLYETLKVSEVRNIEEARVEVFANLYNYQYIKYVSGKTWPLLGLTMQDVNAIWDSTQRNTTWGKWLRSVARYNTGAYYLYSYNRNLVRRKFNFDFSIDSMYDDKLRKLAYYNSAKSHYKGHVREKLLVRLLAEEIIQEIGPTDKVVQAILKDYFSETSFPELKKWIRSYYTTILAQTGSTIAPDFSLVNEAGKPVTKADLEGKIVLLDFWFTGCTGCIQMAPALKELEKKFANDTNVLFVSISTDRYKPTWQKSIAEGKYTAGAELNLYTGGKGASHAMIKDYGIAGYPSLCLIDGRGSIIKSIPPDPRSPGGMEELVRLIKEHSLQLQLYKLSSSYDGPYVMYNDAAITIANIKPVNGKPSLEKAVRKKDEPVVLTVATNMTGVHFTVPLKKQLTIEPCVFQNVSKQLVVSDIEGNFDAFRKLLQANGVIDESFNWTFGNGHLVLNGDFFDRGMQVTETLWLVYALEEKAKVAGGYVHFILGNHEIMNMSGNDRYVRTKYHATAHLMNTTSSALYDENSELGRWLRTKNIVEKVGDVLYMHGGISPEVNGTPWSLEQINTLARPFYSTDTTAARHADQQIRTLYNAYTSPFWYRHYYQPDHYSETNKHLYYHATPGQLDSTLQKFGVKHIATGHTVIADSITTHFDNRVINTDTRHAEGKSEALLIEGDRFYRVNAEGRRILLFVDDKKKI